MPLNCPSPRSPIPPSLPCSFQSLSGHTGSLSPLGQAAAPGPALLLPSAHLSRLSPLTTSPSRLLPSSFRRVPGGARPASSRPSSRQRRRSGDRDSPLPPPTVAACAVNVTPPSAAPPYAAAFLASDAPPHGLLPAPAVAPQSEPCSPPLLPVFLPRPHTVWPLAAVPLTSASRRRSPPPANAGLPLHACPLPRFVRAFPASASCVSLPLEPGLPAKVHRGQAVLPDGWGPSHATPPPAPLLPRLRLGPGVPRMSTRRHPAAGDGAPVPRRAPARRRPPALHRALAPCHAPACRRYPARRRIPARHCALAPRRAPARRGATARRP
ncbi:unnamed protein product [Closterium sp. Naga37s-1]|nr:unnamed protein product [Closterium sp. Naga37s-1]